jgi:hypothetical protein
MTRQIVVFLCYTGEDRNRVEELYEKLDAEGFAPWMDAKDIIPGELWENCIERAIKESGFFLACLSRNFSVQRGFNHAEIKKALRIWEEKLESDIYFIPVKLEDCEVPGELSRFHCANIFNKNGLESLLTALKKGINRKKAVLYSKEQDIAHTMHDKINDSTPSLNERNGEFSSSFSLLERYNFEHDFFLK